MKILITNIEPEYINISTPDGPDFFLNYVRVSYEIVNEIVNENINGTMQFPELLTLSEMEIRIEQRLIGLFNETN